MSEEEEKVNPLDVRNDPPRPFFEHLCALRDCVIGMATSWVVCAIIAGVFAPQILDWIKEPALACEEISNGTVKLEGLDLTSGFDTIISIALWGGTALSFPFLIYFVLRFIFPALTKREQLSVVFCLFVGSAFFGTGVWMAYAKTLPVVVKVFLQFAEWVHLDIETIKVDGYLHIVLKTIIAFGLALQMPLIVFVLGWLGIISSDTLRKYRRLAIVIIFFMGMVLTPPDPMSQLLMATPLCLLYEVCIWTIKLRELATGRGKEDED